MAELVSVKQVDSNGTAGVSLDHVKLSTEKKNGHVNENLNDPITHTGENGTSANGVNGHSVQNGASNGLIEDSTTPSSETKVSPKYDEPSQGGYWTTKADSSVRLRIGDTKATSRAPMTVNVLLERVVKQFPNRIALGVKREGKWRHWTYSEYYEEVRAAAKSFIKVSEDI